jgi:superfamily I DNA/RNA helicase
VAGPGTGKSSSIEERVRWLIQDNGVAPEHIYTVSFTRAAATELRARVRDYRAKNGVEESDAIRVTTLHSLALRTLRAGGELRQYPADPMVLDDWELKRIFESEFAQASAITPTRSEEIRRDHEAFWSTGQWDPPNYIPPDPAITDVERGNFVRFHGPRTQLYACVLPGEVVRKCVDGVNAGTLDPVSLLNIEQLVVDEFQDLNPCDIDFVDHFAKSEVATFVAGDDDQSLYSFRFASPRGIQQFVSNNPSAGDYTLDSCLRCAPSVVATGNALIRANSPPERIAKTLTSLYVDADPPIAGVLHRTHFPSALAEARAIAKSCHELLDQGVSAREILILLSNTNLTEKAIVDALVEGGIPYVSSRKADLRNLDVGRLLLAIERIVCDEHDYVALRTLLGLLNGVGVGTCHSIATKAILNNLNYRDLFRKILPGGVFTPREVNALSRAREIVARLSDWTCEQTLFDRGKVIEELMQVVGVEDGIGEWHDVAASLPAEMSLREVRDYLLANNDEQQAAIVRSCLERLGDVADCEVPADNRIRIMTMHGAKGLSAQVVIIPALEEEIIPGEWRRPYPGLVLEAARMLYVSITRARVACLLSYATRRTIFGKSVGTHASRFCKNLNGPFTYSADPVSSSDAAHIAKECEQL